MAPSKKISTRVQKHKNLVRRRSNVLGSAAQIQIFDREYTDDQHHQLRIRIDHLDELWREFCVIQDEIELLEDKDPDEFSEYRSDFQNVYSELKASLVSKLPSTSPRSGPISNINNLIPQSIRLPEIKIPEFHGNPEDWIGFHDLFHSLIHTNTQLSAVQKMHYLRASLKGEPARLVSGIEVSAENYTIAWKTICERYENKNLLIKRHITALFSTPQVKRESASALLELVDEFDRHVTILNKLESANSHWNSVLVEVLSRRLDVLSLKEWETQCSDDRRPNYDQLVEFIRKRSRILETVKLSQNNHLSGDNRSQRVKPISTFVVTDGGSKCPICKLSHPLYQCEQFRKMEPNKRFETVKKYGVCINCLRGSHMAKNCSSSTCRQCSKKHHTMLHLPPRTVQGQQSSSNITGTVADTHQDVNMVSSELSHSQSQPSLSFPIAVSQACRSSLGTSQLSNNVVEPVEQSHSFSVVKALSPSSVGSFEGVVKNSVNIDQHSSNFARKREGEVFLSTASIRIKDESNKYQIARTLLDSCSQRSFISESLAAKLGLKKTRTSVDVTGIGQGVVHVKEAVNAKISSRYGNYHQSIKCLVVPQITMLLPTKHVDISQWNIPSDLPLADPKFNISAGIDVLLGAELFYSLLDGQRITLADNLPTFQRTVFGYVVSGKFLEINQTPAICVISTSKRLDGLLERFWEVENLDVRREFTLEEQLCEEHFRKTVSRTNDGRYMVRLPVREEALSLLGDSYSLAQRRFLTIERRMQADDSLRSEYVKFMTEYAQLGHMEPSPLVTSPSPQFFLPHHAIHRPDSTTTKTRIVFDASCKGCNQMSLNDILYTGPTIQPTLLATVLNFRMPRFVFIADIEKMFRQILVHPDDRKLQQIVWRIHPLHPLERFQLNTVTYGTSCAPYLATRVLNQLADDDGGKFPLGAAIIRNGFYMDDTLAGFDDLDQAIEACKQLMELLSRGGFRLRKWCANDDRVLLHIPNDLRETLVELEIDRSSIVKTLGLLWSPKEDLFGFRIPKLKPLEKITKRAVVSEMAQLFDPLGLIGSVVVRAKIFVQFLWAERYQWDSELPTEHSNWWIEYRNQISHLSNLKIPRRVMNNSLNRYSLHCFCDASERGYGSCVYVVSSDERGVTHSHLLMSKSRVAPLQGLSIPRLELCAALLGGRLMNTICQSTNLSTSSTFWTDSSIVLHWINSSPATWKVFVSNRVAEIQRLTKGCSWRHVPSELNPADRISRGIFPRQILDDKLWWHGPSFLVQEKQYWPKNIAVRTINQEEEEAKRSIISLPTAVEIDDSIFDRYAELAKLVKVTAYILRFYNNCRKRSNRQHDQITPNEYSNALKYLIKHAQSITYGHEIKLLQKNQPIDKSSLRNLNLFLDESGLLRIGGRLVKLVAPIDTRTPILLPANHKLAWMIARSIHLQTLHSGPTLLLATIRQRFWPIRGRDLARKIVRHCITCFRCNPRPNHQQMAPLPAVRLTPARVFVNSGLDYCGPFLVRPSSGRGASVKAYVAVYVCMVVKAIHLDVVVDLTSAACINSLKRFIARRGRVTNLYCDNATTFIGADRELKKMRNQYLAQFETEIWNNFCLEQGINFHFIPARSPHFGGLWEAGVKSFKHHFKRILGNRSFTMDELTTAVVQIEGILNSRPLTPLSNHPQDLAALTPGHFLIGEPLFSLPEPDLSEITTNRLSRLQEMKRAVQDFWKRWSKDYVSELHQRPKWHKAREDVKRGQLVLMKQDQLPPLQWNLGRVAEIFPGSDGRIRVVQVRTARGLYKRAVTEIFVLPIDENDNSISPSN